MKSKQLISPIHKPAETMPRKFLRRGRPLKANDFSAERSPFATADLNDINKKIAIDSKAHTFLKKHPQLIPLINNAANKLAKYFTDSSTDYYLSLIYNPDTKAQGLCLEIYATLPFAKALSCLERFEDEWWLDNLPDNLDDLVIDVIFA